VGELAKRVVVKVGSSTIGAEDGGLDTEFLRGLIAQVAELRSAGCETVVVSSGAVAAGIAALKLARRPVEMPELQAAAAAGQVRVISTYAELFAEAGMTVAQVLLTRHDVSHRQQYLYACRTFERLLAMGAVPVVNENDTTAVDEIRFGDNDTLAALVGIMVKADLVVMLTDIEGLYSADPRTSGQARLLTHVAEVTEAMLEAASGPGSEVGTGGMATKVEAARTLMKAGIPMVVCEARRPRVVVDAAEGKPVGTYFAGGDAELASRKLWIAFGRAPVGSVTIDDGAREALCLRGKSLLPAGVVEVTGDFVPGDTVALHDRAGNVIARGLTAISSAELRRVKGMRSADIARVLPDHAGVEVVHRDSLVIL